jgi:hypothetical protein
MTFLNEKGQYILQKGCDQTALVISESPLYVIQVLDSVYNVTFPA